MANGNNNNKTKRRPSYWDTYGEEKAIREDISDRFSGAQSEIDKLIVMNDLKKLLKVEFSKGFDEEGKYIKLEDRESTDYGLEMPYIDALHDLWKEGNIEHGYNLNPFKEAIDWRDMVGGRQHELAERYPGGDTPGIMGFLQRLIPGGKLGTEYEYYPGPVQYDKYGNRASTAHSGGFGGYRSNPRQKEMPKRFMEKEEGIMALLQRLLPGGKTGYK